jgi:hypothetical protein
MLSLIRQRPNALPYRCLRIMSLDDILCEKVPENQGLALASPL